ncbi:MAG: hypothetical protein ACRDIY_08450 [Chloroflexota bacterium]
MIRALVAIVGILGTGALVVYYSAPFWMFPLPPDNATAAQVVTFGARYHDVILLDTWLQAIGALLSVVFALALVHLAGAEDRFAGRLTLLVGGAVLILALVEGAFALGALQAGANGHPEAALTCLDVYRVFVHVFLIAPSLFLVMGIALLDTRLLPPAFSYLAVGLGIVFQVLGVAGLFSSAALLAVIVVLKAQDFWTVAAAVALVVRSGDARPATRI